MLGLGIGSFVETADFAGKSLTPYVNSHSLALPAEGDAFNTQTALQTQFRDSFSISIWAKLDKGRTASTEYLFGALVAQNIVTLSISANGTVSFVHYANADTTFKVTGAVIPDDEPTDWFHIALVATKNSSSHTTYGIYLNGVDQGGTQFFGVSDTNHEAYTSTIPLVFGAHNNSGTISNTAGDGGLIDECAVFTTALTSGQVSAIYNSGVPADLTGHSDLYLYYKLNNSVTDEVGNSNGVLVNNAAFSTTVPS